MEATLPSGAGIDKQAALNLRIVNAVAVAEDNNIGGRQAFVVELVDEMQSEPSHLQIDGEGEAASFLALINISTDSIDRGDCGQLLDNGQGADITGVEDHLHPGEEVSDTWIQIAVRI